MAYTLLSSVLSDSGGGKAVFVLQFFYLIIFPASVGEYSVKFRPIIEQLNLLKQHEKAYQFIFEQRMLSTPFFVFTVQFVWRI